MHLRKRRLVRRRLSRGRKLNKRQKREVKSLVVRTIGPEKKYVDILGGLTLLDTTPDTVCLSTVVAGTGDNQRIGDTLTMKSLRFRCQVLWNSADGPAPAQNLVRVVIYQWRPQAAPGTPPPSSGILGGSYTPASVFSSVSLPYTWDTRHEYKILMDAMIPVDLYHCQRWKTKTIYKFSRSIQFAAGTTTGTGHIFLLTLADYTGVNGPTLNYNSRLEYTDS